MRKQWNNYLVTYALNIGTQLSTDDFLGDLVYDMKLQINFQDVRWHTEYRNDTNLAIKGTIGIMAMSKIAGLLGKTDVQSNYSVSLSRFWNRFSVADSFVTIRPSLPVMRLKSWTSLPRVMESTSNAHAWDRWDTAEQCFPRASSTRAVTPAIVCECVRGFPSHRYVLHAPPRQPQDGFFRLAKYMRTSSVSQKMMVGLTPCRQRKSVVLDLPWESINHRRRYRSRHRREP